MADITLVKISALPAAEQIGAEDLLPVVQEGATKAVAYGVIKDDIANELAPDATLSEAGKAADAKAVGDALALKADKTELTAEVSRIDAALATKANTNDVNAALATKANTDDVTAALALKADTATVNAGLSLKADKTELTAGLATKQNVLTFDSTPTQGSTNPVTSGGIYQAIPALDDTLTVAGDAADAKITGDAITELKNDFDRIPNSSLELIDNTNFPATLIETLTGKYPSGSIGSKITFSDADNAQVTKKFVIPHGVTQLYSRIKLNSFTRITDFSGTILATGATSINAIPEEAKYLYISGSTETLPGLLLDDIIWVSNTNQFVHATEHTLYSPEYKDYYRNIIKPVTYDNLLDSPVPLADMSDLTQTVFNITKSSSLEPFTSNSGHTKISVEISATQIEENVSTIRVMYFHSGTWRNASTADYLLSGDHTYNFEVDCASLIQYQNAERFAVFFSDLFKGEILDYKVVEYGNIITYPYYDASFPEMMVKVFNALSSGQDADCALNLRNPSGEKYGLMITPSNTLGTFKYVPENMLIMGNSLVFGFSHGEESFGMAATSGENDFSYHVIEEIKTYNANVIVNKLYSSPFEHCETLADAQAFLAENTDYWSANVDLVIIEMGDNVNTSAKRTVFAQSFPLLLNKIRTQCPKARIVCVGIWFNNATVYNIMTENATKYGCEFVDIRGIRSPETEGELGATVYFKDGTTTTVTEARVTHPGNLGMERIADAIIAQLDM